MSASTARSTIPDSQTEDHALFVALSTATGAERERIQDILVRRHTGLVRWLASRYANPNVEIEELVQVGFVGLVLAIQRYDPERGHDFISFARPTVQGEIRRYFRDKRRWIRLPRRLQETKAALRGATEKLTHDLGRGPTVDELALHLAVDPELVLEAMTADDVYRPRSLDAPMGADDHDSWSLADIIGGPDDRLDLAVDSHTLRPLLAALTDREKKILAMRFFENRSQSEIGLALGLSQMHISRLLSRTLATLRAQMSGEVAAVA
jgi:RNA polymerase sigma-B factor